MPPIKLLIVFYFNSHYISAINPEGYYMNTLINTLKTIFGKCLPIWNYTLLENDIITLHLGNIVLAVIIYFTGRKLSRMIVTMLDKYVLKKYIRDAKAQANLISITGNILTITVLILVLLALGISSTVFVKIWLLTLFTIKDNPIQLGNIIIGLILLVVGLGLSRYISAQVIARIPRQLTIEVSVIKTLETIVKYLLIIIVCLFVLSVVGIPLTAFTVIGGAFAIGIGLGSQHLVNNFLSGLVLMMERPLKVGDIVEMENRRGVVEHIGGRSTRIRTFENYRMVMPNSKLLENTVVNWSLVDNYLRREVSVGVAYGSPVQEVHDLILKAVRENPAVEKKPKPMVIFTDFGDSALMFKAFFWIQLTETIYPMVIESDVRFRIDELFREAGIVIAFPQSDIHLDTLKPMEVKITNLPGNMSGAKEG